MLRFVSVSSMLTLALTAQSSQGPFVGLPIHFGVGANTIGPGSALLDTNQLYLKRAGFNDLLIAPPYSPTRPEFTMDAMFGAARPAGFRVDAFSSGFCTVFATYDAVGDPVLSVPPGAWGALLFSVTRNSVGGGSAVVQAEAATPDGASADVFSLVLPGSTLPASLAACVPIGVAQRANDNTEMGFASGSPHELGDFDPFLSFYEVEGSLASYLVPDPWVFFSISVPPVGLPAPVQAMVTPWFNARSGPPLVPPANQISGATILRTRWLSTAVPPRWSTPEVFLAWNELGLAINDDIDALAVEESGLVALSLRRSPTRTLLGEQLMVAEFQWHAAVPWSYPSCSRTVRPFYYDDGTDAKDPLARPAGAAGGGDIDGICEVDPSNANGIAGRGFPFVHDCRAGLPFAVPMAASAFPTLSTSPTTTTVAMSVAGIPTTLVGIGALLADIRPSGSPATLFYPVTLDLWVVAGSRHGYTWNVPAVASGYGVELELQFLSMDITGALSLADVVRLRM